MRTRLRILTGLTLALGGWARAQPGQAPLRIGSWDRDSDPLTAISEAVLTRAYAELGRSVEMVGLPNRRAMQGLLNGELDGNLHRVYEIAALHPGLLRVEPAISASAVRVYSYDAPLGPLQDWAQLAGLRVAYQRGVLRIEQMLPAGARRVEAGSVTELFRLLKTGIADVALCTEFASGPPLRRGERLRRLEQPLEEHKLYHYLGGGQAELARQLSGLLQRWQASGELEAIRQAALRQYLHQHPAD